jgi:hypothetical protein
MDSTIKQRFSERWRRYFPDAELPIAFAYTDEPDPAGSELTRERFRCLICDLAPVRNGATRSFSRDTIGCGGGRRYLGFEQELRPRFAHFLSCGIPGELDGERYKQSPELVEDYLDSQPAFEAPAPHVVFKRWDRLDADDRPEVVVFFARPDVLSGLFTLANFDEADPQAVRVPFGSGCASVVYQPYLQLDAEHPRAVLGMFDVSARPCVPSDVLTFAVPWPKFVTMIDNMDSSFLTTDSWQEVRSRMRRA